MTIPLVQPHISPDYINVVCQTLPSFPALELQVAVLLAQDAEYYIRELIHLAKKRMRHSRRCCLTVHDVQLADSRRELQPSFGHFASVSPTFQPVTSCPGLFVIQDRVVSLFDILETSMPSSSPSANLKQSGIISPYITFTTVPSYSPAFKHSVIQTVEDAVLSNQFATHLLQSTWSYICSASALPLYSLLEIIRDIVHTNARIQGNTCTLFNALRIVTALVSRPTFGVELFEDVVISIVLTCLLAPNLGQGDVYALRELAAETLCICLTHVVDDFVRQRVCNTLASALADPKATLSCIFGAVIGLAVMGRHVFEPIVMPLVPKLLGGLDNLLIVSAGVGYDKSDQMLPHVIYICRAMERSLHICDLLQTDPDFIDVFL